MSRRSNGLVALALIASGGVPLACSEQAETEGVIGSGTLDATDNADARTFGATEGGAPCTNDSECTSGFRCVVTRVGEFDRGTCVAPPDASDGGGDFDATVDGSPLPADGSTDARDGALTDFDLLDGASDARDSAGIDFNLNDAGDASDARDSAGIDFNVNDAGDASDASACTLGATRPCYTGPVGTENVGTCRGGTSTCSDLGRGPTWGACTDQVLPEFDTLCDGIDRDCDGTTLDANRAPTFGVLCPKAGLPSCRAGVIRCVGASLECADAVCIDREICGDGYDNDCNGTADDGCALPTVRVGCPGAPFTTLAAAVAGRTVQTRFEVCGGTYTDALEPPHVPMEFVAVPGTGAVILDGSSLPTDVVRLGSYRTLAYRFEGFDIANAPRRGIDGTCVELTLVDTLVRENRSGGIYVRDSRLELQDSRVEDNRVTESTNGTRVEGAGIRALRTSVILTRSLIARNVGTQTASFGTNILGGGVFVDTGTLVASDSDVIDNELDGNYSGANPQGAGIYLTQSLLTLTRVRVTGNINRGIAQTYGGGIAVENFGARRPTTLPWVRITDSAVTGNSIPRGSAVGGALSLRADATTADDALVITNTDFGTGATLNAPATIHFLTPSPLVSRSVSGAGSTFTCSSAGACTP